MRYCREFPSILRTALTISLVSASLACVRPRQTTAVGSGVGGAIGAGLGAIVGNQSGNAGSGLAIGAAAGAATGALIGNALQAQEERTASTEEALKRQDRLLQAQKNEIAELRTIRGDSALNYESAATPRYRYRQPSLDIESPEVARQRARLQQRGPRPSGASPVEDYSYQPRAVARQSSKSEVLARYDIRSDLDTKPTKSTATTTHSRVVGTTPSSPTKQAALPSTLADAPPKTDSKGLSEADLPISQTTSAKLVDSQTRTSPECKEALAERDRAVDSSENSDKLFHLRRALRLCPQSGPLHYELGKVYASMERKSDAESEFKQALSIDPSLLAAKRALSDLLKDEVQF